jgi:hypothetical protein
MIKRFKRGIYFAKAYVYLILTKLALQDSIKYFEKEQFAKGFEYSELATKWHEKHLIAYQQLEELTRA